MPWARKSRRPPPWTANGSTARWFAEAGPAGARRSAHHPASAAITTAPPASTAPTRRRRERRAPPAAPAAPLATADRRRHRTPARRRRRPLERLSKLRGRSPAVGGHGRERLRDRGVDGFGHRRPPAPDPRDRIRQPLHQDRLHRRPGVRLLAGQHLEQHGAEAVDVGPGVERAVAAGLLGAHVGRRPDAHAGLGELVLVLGRAERAGDAEVGDEGVAVAGEEQVLGLDVAVDHAVLVGVVQRLRRLAGDPERVLERELPLAPEPVAQALALDERHGEPELAGGCRRSRGRSGCAGAAAGRRAGSRAGTARGRGTAASSGWSTLRATGRSCLRSCARKTVAMPPRPSSRRRAYGQRGRLRAARAGRSRGPGLWGGVEGK